MEYKFKPHVSFLKKDTLIKNIEIAVVCIVIITIATGIYSML